MLWMITVVPPCPSQSAFSSSEKRGNRENKEHHIMDSAVKEFIKDELYIQQTG
jgi:hypothetical protein